MCKKRDCMLAEINPLVVNDEGNLVALDAKIMIDDSGVARQPDLAELQKESLTDPLVKMCIRDRYMIMPEYHVYHISDSMSFDVAALIEPISIAYEAFKRTKLDKNSTVVVTGTGAIGMGAVALAGYYGAGQIICVGRKEAKLAVANELGATHIINNRCV